MTSVKLVGMTKPSAETGCTTANDLVAYAARVSNPTNQNSTSTAPKLIGYLIKHKHWSPFEMVHITMEIQTTRDISRQILRHRSFSFQEFSQRYAVSENFCTREARMQDTKNRQNSVELDMTNPVDREIAESFKMKQAHVTKQARQAYEWALENGIAKEQARALLPEGLTETTLYMAGSLRSWIHYCDLRGSNGTQKEHIEVARKCWDIISQHFPDVADAVEWYSADK